MFGRAANLRGWPGATICFSLNKRTHIIANEYTNVSHFLALYFVNVDYAFMYFDLH